MNSIATAKAILEVVPDNIFFKDKESRFSASTRLWQITVASKTHRIIGRTDADIFSAEHANQAWLMKEKSSVRSADD